MADVPTEDIARAVAQCEAAYAAGSDYFRFTAQGVRQAEALAEIAQAVKGRGLDMPLVADIHFSPAAAFEAIKHVEAVRINPGNFAELKGEVSAEEAARYLAETFGKLLDEAIARKRALRIGVNHGSLSRRIVEQYGDTPRGMVQSAMEYIRLAHERDFHDLVISMKSSNVRVMTESVHLLVQTMDAEGLNYPLHLGVTEAGSGEDGRIKSAVGIGSLLADGIGDTIRVSLSEPPECELPVARALVQHVFESRQRAPLEKSLPASPYYPHMLTHTERPFVWISAADVVQSPGVDGDRFFPLGGQPAADAIPFVLNAPRQNAIGYWRSRIAQLAEKDPSRPVVLAADYEQSSLDEATIAASCDLGTLLLEQPIAGIWLRSSRHPAKALYRLALGILQASRLRFSHTEIISCPGCGRTLYNLQETAAAIKKELGDRLNLKIAVMGCIVNGPGEMADADYGYIGGAPGKIDLYKGRTCIERGIPQEEALARLKALIDQDA